MLCMVRLCHYVFCMHNMILDLHVLCMHSMLIDLPSYIWQDYITLCLVYAGKKGLLLLLLLLEYAWGSSVCVCDCMCVQYMYMFSFENGS